MDVRTDGRTMDRLWHEINIPFFSKEKSGYNYDGGPIIENRGPIF